MLGEKRKIRYSKCRGVQFYISQHTEVELMSQLRSSSAHLLNSRCSRIHELQPFILINNLPNTANSLCNYFFRRKKIEKKRKQICNNSLSIHPATTNGQAKVSKSLNIWPSWILPFRVFCVLPKSSPEFFFLISSLE